MSENSVLPFLPYGGRNRPNSGHAGSETSELRAANEDRVGKTKERQRDTMIHLRIAAETGLTWHELAEHTGWHHGQASGVLSSLHQGHQITRLAEVRNRCKVYVLNEFVGERQIEYRNLTASTLLRRRLARTLGQMIAAHPCPHGPLPEAGCPCCEAKAALRQFESTYGVIEGN